VVALGAVLWDGSGATPAHASRAADSADAVTATVAPFLARNCQLCHNAQLKQGELDIEALAKQGVVADNAATWEKLVLQMKTGEMPPAPMPRPSAEDLAAVTDSIQQAVDRAFDAAPPEPGRVTARRLNRSEYDNTVRDLLGVDIGAADDFPPDDSGYGFDNIGDVLSLSPALMERYMATAERVAKAAVFGVGDMKPVLTRHAPGGRKIRNREKAPHDYDATGLTLPNALHVTKRFPAAGEYVVRVTIGGQRPAGSEPLTIALWLDGTRVEAQTIDPEKQASFAAANDRQDLAGMMREFRVRVPAGEHSLAAVIERIYEGLPADYDGPNPSPRKLAPPEFKPPPNLPPEKLEERRKAFEARLKERVPANGPRVGLVEISGPYALHAGPAPASVRKLYVCGHTNGKHARGCERKILESVLRRAFRRPLLAGESARYARLFAAARKDGGSFEHGLALALQAILVSPDFLFRIEGAPQRRGDGGMRLPRDEGGPKGASPSGRQASTDPQQLTPHELASRLAYFLWSSMPDDELLRLADSGALREPDVLAAQVRRLLADPKSAAFVKNFGGQWLQFRALESIRPDTERFPEFDDYLRLSMRRETELFLEALVREDRSILDVVDARYTFVNERLARHYGIAGVRGPEFRRVDLQGTPRAGVLGHASVLTVSSYPTRTSPVLRGKWVLENLLNAKPPDPPAGTPRLDEKSVGKGASLRQQLEAHRSDAICAACHSRMDPLGFSLENYDAIGGWREKDGATAIDASGKLPDGRAFNGPAELATILKADHEEFARGFTAKLLTYALGRGLERYDRPTVKAIAARAAKDDYRFSALVVEIVGSLPFQMRRPEVSTP
jgi:mono/diheme cytochrome c family protein